MKDIYNILNSANTDFEESIEKKFSEKEQENILNSILLKDKEKYRVRKVIKKSIGIAAAVGLITILAMNPTIQTIASNVVTYFTENTKKDYKKEVNEKAEAQTANMEMLSVTREDSEISLKVKLEFNENIEELKELCEKGEQPKIVDFESTYANKSNREIKYFENKEPFNYNYPEGYVLDAPPFKDCKILINNVDFNKEEQENFEVGLNNYLNGTKDYFEQEYALDKLPIRFITARNVEVHDNILIQNIVLYLDENYNEENIDISFHYKDIKLRDHTIEGEWNIDYTIVGNEFDDGQLNKMPINYSFTTSWGPTFTLNSYSITPAGIKIYGDSNEKLYTLFSEEPRQETIIYLVAYDDIGNKYLLYPTFPKGLESNEAIYSIYDGPADENDEYKDFLDENAKTLTIKFEATTLEEDDPETHENLREIKDVSTEELTLNIENKVE